MLTTVVRMAKLAGINHRHSRHPVRTLIDATSRADRRSKSHWKQALRYAWRKRDTWSSVGKCLRANGGISESASKWAEMRAETRMPPGFVRSAVKPEYPRYGFSSASKCSMMSRGEFASLAGRSFGLQTPWLCTTSA